MYPFNINPEDRMQRIKKETYSFSQKDLITNPQDSAGLCAPITNVLMKDLLDGKPLSAFHERKKTELYRQVKSMELRMTEAAKDGKNFDAIAFDDHGYQTKTDVVEPAKLSTKLEEAKAAFVTYQTKSGEDHQLLFHRDHHKCTFHNSNVETTRGSCEQRIRELTTTVARSNPSVVKISSISQTESKLQPITDPKPASSPSFNLFNSLPNLFGKVTFYRMPQRGFSFSRKQIPLQSFRKN